MMQPPVQSRNAGFTLVEMLVATLLMAFILGALATVTAQWLPNWSRGFARAQRIQLLSVGMERLVADLSAAQIVSAGGVNDPPIFEGTELSVTFVRTALGPNAQIGLEVVRMAETSDSRGPAMVRTTAPFVPATGDALDRGQFNFANAVVLVAPPYRAVFSYAGPDRQWRDTWRAEPQLPRAIRVRIRDAATSETLAVSTSALVRAELPARWQKPQQGVR
jgi:general secretion pathway protein J